MSVFLLLISIGLSAAVLFAADWIPSDADIRRQSSALFALLCIVLGPLILMHFAALTYAAAALFKGDGRLPAMLGLFPNLLFLPPLFAFQQLMEKLDALPPITA